MKSPMVITLLISIASIWEIGIKTSIVKLYLGVELEELKNEIVKNEFELLPLDFDHIIELTKLEAHHKDLFDRILISQAVTENLIIITRVTSFKQYKKVEICW